MAVGPVPGFVILVDSNTWGDFFNGTDSPHVDRLLRALEEQEDIAVLPLIVTEVVQGFRTDGGFQKARDLLLSLTVLVPSVECHVDAARLFRDLRRKGVTVRGTVDCIIARAAIEAGAELVSPDADFERIAGQSPLKLWRP